MNKRKFLVSITYLCLTFSLMAQNYNETDLTVLQDIDGSCDVGGNLNWDTEPDPSDWNGVSWNDEDPGRVIGLDIADKELVGNLDLRQLPRLLEIDCSLNNFDTLNVSGLVELTLLDCNTSVMDTLIIQGMESLQRLNMSGNPISGIMFNQMPSLRFLDCRFSQVTDLQLSGLSQLKTILAMGNESCGYANISNLSALEYLNMELGRLDSIRLEQVPKLRRVLCSDNRLMKLHISGVDSLSILDCSINRLSALDIEEPLHIDSLLCTENQLNTLPATVVSDSRILQCQSNQISGELDLSGNTNLEELICWENKISGLNLTGDTNLIILKCNDNRLTQLDLSEFQKLEKFDCGQNQLEELDISRLTNLISLGCSDNQISKLDVGSIEGLLHLDCMGNQLDTIDVSGLAELKNLSCNNNLLKVLKLDGAARIETLNCEGNNLMEIDLSSQINLRFLALGDNPLTSIDLSTLVNLEQLVCLDTQIEDLDMSHLTSLSLVLCYRNQLKTIDLTGTDNLYLNCRENHLPFSELQKGLKFYPAFDYDRQGPVFSPQESDENITIDYSSEAIIQGESTNFVWYKDDEVVASNSSGVFTTTGSGIYFCEMTNPLFSSVQLRSAPVRIGNVGTGIQQEDAQSVSLYPNPAHEAIYLENLDAGTPYMLYNSKGQLVRNDLYNGNHIDVSEVDRGLYLLSIKLLIGISTYRIVID